MILPPPCLTIWAPKCLQDIMTPLTLMLKSLSHSSMGNSMADALVTL